MPTCLASSSGLLRSSAHHHSSSTLKAARYAARSTRRCGARCASTAPARVQQDRRTNVLTTLHKTTTLLPRILPSGKSSLDGVTVRESLPFWEEVLRKVYDDLTLAPEKRGKDRVRVVGTSFHLYSLLPEVDGKAGNVHAHVVVLYTVLTALPPRTSSLQPS